MYFGWLLGWKACVCTRVWATPRGVLPVIVLYPGVEEIGSRGRDPLPIKGNCRDHFAVMAASPLHFVIVGHEDHPIYEADLAAKSAEAGASGKEVRA